jgi:heme exporter protein C
MTRLVPFLLVIAALMFMRAPFIIGDVANESTMGLVQKIFYFHVPAAITTFLSVFVCGLASIVYLVRRNRTADHVAVAAAELAVVFGLMVIVTGPLWARKAWGVWWNWGDARLLMTFVMWMVFVGYLLLRKFGGPGSEMLAAVAGIFGMVLVPFVYWSATYWRTIHPPPTVIQTLPPEMRLVLNWCIYAFLVLYGALLILRTQLETHRARLDDAFLALED